ncbi:MAG: DUF1194 domain-containing protein [Kiloniellales bacterium]|nr:DUF1194 domain-containing protein [Kiloniellales bacterium]
MNGLRVAIGRFRTAALGVWLGLANPFTPAVAQSERLVDLELILAVDVSSSVDAAEFDLQMQGLAAAFRDPAVLAAIRATGGRGIAVSLIQWSAGGDQTIAVDWTAVRDRASADLFADRLARTPRLILGGDTSIKGAIRYAARQFEQNGFAGLRQVIDISGDGGAIVTLETAMPDKARDGAVAQGITINGLAILDEVPHLQAYYRDYVIGGAGAFVMVASDYQDFAAAMLEKLVREISDRPVASLPSPGAEQP